jgi:hypothetical protein
MPYFGYALLNKVSVITMKVLEVIKTYYQNMA